MQSTLFSDYSYLNKRLENMDSEELLRNIEKADSKLLDEIKNIEDRRATLKIMKDMIKTLK